MGKYRESDFAEVIIDRLILESFSEKDSAYYEVKEIRADKSRLEKLRSKVKWHISRSLSQRQKEVLQLILRGKKETEIARILGIKQQVVNIYKHRAIKKLRQILEH
jgi:DNA-binding CsgD family transcriptional regulator